ncbi:uncharacterized protein LOC135956254 isoform X2 [Calliphora vicina]|uniref:uncharacterized protein LOC135956254 isoform X2 n=1 Tax=Calliphora vicina TaxID=7373 RepID=UPI00325BB55D
MKFTQYFAIFVIVVLCLLGHQAAQAHSLFGDLKKDVESDAHKVGAKLDNIGDKVESDTHEVEQKVDNIGDKVESDTHEVGQKVESTGHKVVKTAKKAYKVYKIVKGIEVAGKVIGAVGSIAGVIEKA